MNANDQPAPGLDWLQPFCLQDGDYMNTGTRQWLRAPFTIGETTYATDGRIMVAVPKIPGIAFCDPSHVVGVLLVAEDLPGKLEDVWVPLALVSLPEVRTEPEDCADCHGDGGEDRGVACDSCGGKGWFEVGVRVHLGNKYLGAQYLAKMCALPKLEIAPTATPREKPLPFRFNGGVGILMPMSRRS